MVLLASDSLRQREEWLEHLQRAARHLKEDTYITDQKETPSFTGPSSKVLDTLLRAGLVPGKRLVNNLHEAKDILSKGANLHGEYRLLTRQLQSKLHDVHANIVELDDSLPTDEELSGFCKDSRSECRSWLNQAQTFIMYLQQEIDTRCKDVCCATWPELYSSMHSVFKTALVGVDKHEPPAVATAAAPAPAPAAGAGAGAAVAVVATGGAPGLEAEKPRSDVSTKEAAAPRKLCRAVVPCSQLRYSTYWARKVAI